MTLIIEHFEHHYHKRDVCICWRTCIFMRACAPTNSPHQASQFTSSRTQPNTPTQTHIRTRTPHTDVADVVDAVVSTAAAGADVVGRLYNFPFSDCAPKNSLRSLVGAWACAGARARMSRRVSPWHKSGVAVSGPNVLSLSLSLSRSLPHVHTH